MVYSGHFIKWDHIIFDLLWLVSFTYCNVFKRLCMMCYVLELHFFLWLTFRCMDIVCLNDLFLRWWMFGVFFLLFLHYSCTSFVWAYTFSSLGRMPRSILWSLYRSQMDQDHHPKFDLHIKTDDVTCIPRGCEAFSHNEAFWGEQGKASTAGPEITEGRKKRRLVWGVCCALLRWNWGDGSHTREGGGVASNFELPWKGMRRLLSTWPDVG